MFANVVFASEGATVIEVNAGGIVRAISATASGPVELEDVPVQSAAFSARVQYGKWGRGGRFFIDPFEADVAPDISTPTISPSSGNLTTTFSAGYTYVAGFPDPAITYQWKNNGSDISGATSRTYKPASSGTLTCAITATNREGSETVTTSGVAVGGSTTRPAANVTVTAAGTTTIAQAMNAAVAAAGVEYIIDVAPGTYSRVTLADGYNRAGRVILRAADPGDPPVIRGIDINGSRRVTLDGLIIRGNTAITGQAKNGDTIYWGARGLRAEGSDSLIVQNCQFDQWSEHAVLWRVTNTSVLDNLWERQSIDSIRLYYSATNVLISGNIFRNPRTWWDSESSEKHPDYIQLESSIMRNRAYVTPEPSRNVTIEDNFFSTEDDYHQCIYAGTDEQTGDSSAPVSTNAHRNLIVRRNYFESAHPHAIGLGSTIDARIEQNLIRDWPGGITWATGNWKPTVTIGGDSEGGVITNNVANRAVWAWGANLGDTNQWTLSGNNFASTTAVPTGWASTRVALGQLGPYRSVNPWL